MLNIVWIFLIIVGIIAGIINGRIDDICTSITESATNAVTFCIGLIGIVAFWNGMIKILEEANIIKIIGEKIKPLIIKIFPCTKENEKARNSIITNITANFLGLGNGATPSGIEAVANMNGNIKDISKFLIINSAGFQLLPTTVIAIRTELGASNPTDILVPTWIVTIISMIASIIFYYIYINIRRIFKKA